MHSDETTEEEINAEILRRKIIEQNVSEPLKRLRLALIDTGSITRFINASKDMGIRTLKTTYQNMKEDRRVTAKITLCGEWLRQTGFEIGDYIRVITMKDLIIITPVLLPNSEDDPPGKEPLHYSVPPSSIIIK